jgi:hypothetical protein
MTRPVPPDVDEHNLTFSVGWGKGVRGSGFYVRVDATGVSARYYGPYETEADALVQMLELRKQYGDALDAEGWTMHDSTHWSGSKKDAPS